MKKMNKYFLAAPIIGIAITLGLSNCTKHNHECINCPTPVVPTAVANIDTVHSVFGTPTMAPIGVNGNAPTSFWNGDVSAWANVPMLTVTGTVPNVATFTGFIGNSTQIQLQSMHDNNNIYWLFQFGCDRPQNYSAQAYYNPKTLQWAYEKTVVDLTNLSPDGSYRPPFGQDEIVMMFNISMPAFNSQSCYALCHVSSGYGSSLTPIDYMATNGPTERLDCWRMRTFQGSPMNQINDCFIDDGSSIGGVGEPSTDSNGVYSGAVEKNMVHSDWQVKNGPATSVPPPIQSASVNVVGNNSNATPVWGKDGPISNKQTLKVIHKSITTNTASPVYGLTKESVPIWVIQGTLGTNPYASRHNAIYLADTLSGTAIKVMGVDTNGVLYSDVACTTVLIDPRSSASGYNYQQVGAGDGPNCIPGTVVSNYTGSQGDVTCNTFYNGSKWIVQISRALTTRPNSTFMAVNDDIDFSNHNPGYPYFPFGVGAMFNGGDNEHAIVTGLILHMK